MAASFLGQGRVFKRRWGEVSRKQDGQELKIVVF